MIQRVLAHPKIQTVFNSVPVEILGIGEGRVKALILRDTQTAISREPAVLGIFVAIGHQPNTSAFAQFQRDENGYFVPESGSQVRTSIPGIYAAGDCVDHTFRQAITAAGMGCQAAIEVERWLAENSSMSPEYEYAGIATHADL